MEIQEKVREKYGVARPGRRRFLLRIEDIDRSRCRPERAKSRNRRHPRISSLRPRLIPTLSRNRFRFSPDSSSMTRVDIY